MRAFCILIAVLLTGGCDVFVDAPAESESEEVGNGSREIPSSWKLYRNLQYQFELRYPPAWRPREDYSIEIRPVISFYRGDAKVEGALSQHQAPYLDYISIFPKGGASEGVLGETRRIQTDEFLVPLDTRRSKAYSLENGQIWATFLVPDRKARSWDQHGFIWAAAEVENFTVACYRDGRRVEDSGCEPLMGDELVRNGQVEPESRRMEMQVLSTFRFLSGNGQEEGIFTRSHRPQPQRKYVNPLTVAKHPIAGTLFAMNSASHLNPPFESSGLDR